MIFSRMVGKYAMVYRHMPRINQFQANSVPLNDWNDICVYFNLWTNEKNEYTLLRRNYRYDRTQTVHEWFLINYKFVWLKASTLTIIPGLINQTQYIYDQGYFNQTQYIYIYILLQIAIKYIKAIHLLA